MNTEYIHIPNSFTKVECDNIKLFQNVLYSKPFLLHFKHEPQIESKQLLYTHLGHGLPPEAEGAELGAAEGGAVLGAAEREHVLHQLAQTAVSGK